MLVSLNKALQICQHCEQRNGNARGYGIQILNTETYQASE